jgi:hypothetical protein
VLVEVVVDGHLKVVQTVVEEVVSPLVMSP